MTSLSDFSPRSIQFYVTASYPCSYLPDREARSQVVTPNELVDDNVYSQLIQAGFRRSGLYVYRPHCDHCQACVPVRVRVDEFVPNRSQRRTMRRNQNLQATLRERIFEAEHYALYRRYQASRHAGGGMDLDNEDQYRQFLLLSGVKTMMIEFREGENLRMVSMIDGVENGLSSVYTFYDPDLPQNSLGTYNILWQVQLCRKLGLPYLYLGYWIAKSRKMAYKINFQPLECLVGESWQIFNQDEQA
ncbi:MAG: arginyltransferase [Sulfuricellaceae bacterium]|nr:arginyltransferase [Sulfuricellaceae bacterium]